MSRQLYAYVNAVYPGTNRALININNTFEGSELVSLDDIELLIASPAEGFPHRFKLRLRDGREALKPWSHWMPPSKPTLVETKQEFRFNPASTENTDGQQ